MESTVKTSSLFSLNLADAAKGVLVAAVTSVLSCVYAALTTTPIVLDFKQIGIVGLTAGLAYLIKNFLTPSQVVSKAVTGGNSDEAPSDPDKEKPIKPTS